MLLLHVVNRLLAALVSLAIVALAVVVAVEVARWGAGEPSWLVPWRSWATSLSELRADDAGLLAAAAVAALVGLLLLAFELAPRRPDVLETAPLLPGVSTGVTRKGLASAATTAARSVSGITSASSKVRRRRIEVAARTRARGSERELRQRVRAAVEQALTDLELRRRVKVRVSLAEES